MGDSRHLVIMPYCQSPCKFAGELATLNYAMHQRVTVKWHPLTEGIHQTPKMESWFLSLDFVLNSIFIQKIFVIKSLQCCQWVYHIFRLFGV